MTSRESLSKTGRKYGWHPDLPGRTQAIKKYSLFYEAIELPPSIDLRPQCPPVYDQGQAGSCVGNGVSACVEFVQPNLGTPSRLFAYYNARIPEGGTNQDGGAEIHDGVQGLVTYGIVPETEWPYNIEQVTTQPTPQCYIDALKDIVTNYFSLNNDQDIKQCLAAGFPVVFGMSVYESFESQAVAQTGVVPMPTASEQCIGGHCMVIVGYNDADSYWIVRNSWGNTWGISGYCNIPYSYIDQFASDFWTIRADSQSTSKSDSSDTPTQ